MNSELEEALAVLNERARRDERRKIGQAIRQGIEEAVNDPNITTDPAWVRGLSKLASLLEES